MAFPRLARALLRRVIPADCRDGILVDLDEMYEVELSRRGLLAARLWAWLQTAGFTWRFSLERGFDASRISALDFRLVVRSIRRTPGLSLVAVLALASGMCLPAIAFTVLHGISGGPLPFPGADRIVLANDYHRSGRYEVWLAAAEFHRRREGQQAFELLGGVHSRRVDLRLGRDPAGVIRVSHVTPSSFGIAGVPAALGRVLDQADAEPGALPVAVLSNTVWRGRLGADSGALGRTIHLAGQPHQVVGVMPPGYGFPAGDDIWVAVSTDPSRGPVTGLPLRVFGRLKPGVTREAAAAELATLSRRVSNDEPVGPRVIGFTDLPEQQAVLRAVTIGLTLLLLVAATNVGHLLLVRSAARSRELAVRAALGASRSRIAGQLSLEALILTALAALVGLALASGALGQLEIRLKDDLPFWASFSIDPLVLAFVVALSLVVTMAAGVVPAWRVTRLVDPLRSAERGNSIRFGRISSLLIAAEIAIAVGCLGAAGLMARGMLSFGFGGLRLPDREILVAQLYFGQPDFSAADQRHTLWSRFLARVEEDHRKISQSIAALPGVRTVTSASHFPGNENEPTAIETDQGPLISGRVVEIRPGYFETLGTRLVAGRDFSTGEVERAAPVAIINLSLARRLGAQPVGRKIRIRRPEEAAPAWIEVIGIAPDLGLNPGNPSRGEGLYIPMPATTIFRVGVRAGQELEAVAARLHEVVSGINPAIQVQWTTSLRAQMDEPVAVMRGLGAGFVVAGAVPLLLASASLFALISFSVTRRTREIGIRRALGASDREVVRRTVGAGAVQLLAGSAAGTALAAGLSKLVLLFPFEVNRDASIGLIVSLAVLSIALLCALLPPARQALRIQPTEAMRSS